MTWALVDNPQFAGKEPRILEAACHDRSAFITVRCPHCRGDNHLHESQFADIPDDVELALGCAHCRIRVVSTVAFFSEAFAQMRADGWIA